MRFAKTHNTAWTRIDFSWTIIFNPRSSLHQRSLCYIYHDRERNEPHSFLTNVSPRPSTSWRSQPPTRTSLPRGSFRAFGHRLVVAKRRIIFFHTVSWLFPVSLSGSTLTEDGGRLRTERRVWWHQPVNLSDGGDGAGSILAFNVG